jgi:hypothetical protein
MQNGAAGCLVELSSFGGHRFPGVTEEQVVGGDDGSIGWKQRQWNAGTDFTCDTLNFDGGVDDGRDAHRYRDPLGVSEGAAGLRPIQRYAQAANDLFEQCERVG